MKQGMAALTFVGLALGAVTVLAQANQVVTLQVQGLSAGQEMKIENALSSIPGVAQVKASSAIGAVVVVYDPVKAQSDAFINAIQSAGFVAKLAKANYQCPHCSAKFAKVGKCIVCDVPLEPIKKT